MVFSNYNSIKSPKHLKHHSMGDLCSHSDDSANSLQKARKSAEEPVFGKNNSMEHSITPQGAGNVQHMFERVGIQAPIVLGDAHNSWASEQHRSRTDGDLTISLADINNRSHSGVQQRRYNERKQEMINNIPVIKGEVSSLGEDDSPDSTDEQYNLKMLSKRVPAEVPPVLSGASHVFGPALNQPAVNHRQATESLWPQQSQASHQMQPVQRQRHTNTSNYSHHVSAPESFGATYAPNNLSSVSLRSAPQLQQTLHNWPVSKIYADQQHSHPPYELQMRGTAQQQSLPPQSHYSPQQMQPRPHQQHQQHQHLYQYSMSNQQRERLPKYSQLLPTQVSSYANILHRHPLLGGQRPMAYADENHHQEYHHPQQQEEHFPVQSHTRQFPQQPRAQHQHQQQQLYVEEVPTFNSQLQHQQHHHQSALPTQHQNIHRMSGDDRQQPFTGRFVAVTQQPQLMNTPGQETLLEHRELIYMVQFKHREVEHKVSRESYEEAYNVSDFVVVTIDPFGEDIGVITEVLTPAEYAAKLEMKRNLPGRKKHKEKVVPMGVILRQATLMERQLLPQKAEDEESALQFCQHIAHNIIKMPMTVFDAEYTFDRTKLTMYYNSEVHIDFRELVKDMFSRFKTRIWMKKMNQELPFYPKQWASVQLATGTMRGTY